MCEILDDGEVSEEVLVVEQTEELIADDSVLTDELMPRSSPDGSTDTDVDNEQNGLLLYALLFYSNYFIVLVIKSL